MTLRSRMKKDLTEAMKRRDQATTLTLRSLLAAIDNAEAVDPSEAPVPVMGRNNDVPRKLLTEEDIHQILHREAEARRAAAAEYERLAVHSAVHGLQAEVALIASYIGGGA